MTAVPGQPARPVRGDAVGGSPPDPDVRTTLVRVVRSPAGRGSSRRRDRERSRRQFLRKP